MTTDQTYETFRTVMETLMAKTKEELTKMVSDPECPPFIAVLIRDHPVLLGECRPRTDVRRFFTPKPAPETKNETTAPETKDEPTEPELEEAYRQGFKDAEEANGPMLEEAWKGGRYEAKDELWVRWTFEPTLQDFAHFSPTLRKKVDEELIYRYPMKEELNRVVWAGELFRFPIGYTVDGIKYATYRACLTGGDWTLREFLERAHLVYSVGRGKHVRAMGDHIVFEGFVGDTFHCGS